MPHPLITYGGTGGAVSGWPLARAVSRLGQFGVVSGTALAVVLARRLQLGEPSGELRHALGRLGQARLFTDPVAAPTGFPSKVAQFQDTLSNAANHHARPRIGDLGYLRHLNRKPDGDIGYRCPADPLEHYRRKGGAAQETLGRKCLCNAFPATAGLPQIRPEGIDKLPLVTAGDDLANLAQFRPPARDSYSAADVLRVLLPVSLTRSDGRTQIQHQRDH